MLPSTVRVPLPASLRGSMTRTRVRLSPSVQARMVMLRSQSSRWMIMVIWE